jgi:hypothetical protein
MIKVIDVSIDHNKLQNEFYKLKVDELLAASTVNQISVQCDTRSKEEIQLYESCGSLWTDINNIDFIEIDFLHFYKKEINVIEYPHKFFNKEPVVFGKSYQGQIPILGIDFEKTYFVKVISDKEFQLTVDPELTTQVIPNVDRNNNLIFRIFRNVSEYRFDTVCNYFKNTYIEEVLNKIQEHYPIYRTRFMLSHPKTNLSWHRDLTKRIHIPIYTNDNCFMIIDDNVIRLPFGNTYLVDTVKHHTAVNASSSKRVHLVSCL